ncbi:MAG: phage tail sheath subtilisin-like domain-containing protein [Alphaproteobacteria bacterium]|nr:phage tail sheath subtilisin-like domain-containing protein [Alphaproteobacteria bacterium]
MPEPHGINVLEVTEGPRTVSQVSTSVVGIVGVAESAKASDFPLNTPVLLNGYDGIVALGGGALSEAVAGVFAQVETPVVVVRVAEGKVNNLFDETTTIANYIGDLAARTGIYALSTAGSKVGYTPKIIVAADYAWKDSVSTAMTKVCELVRGVGIVGLNSASAAAVVADISAHTASERLFPVWPPVTPAGADATVAQDGYVAGAIARRDAEYGFWWSPSNIALLGIEDTSPALDDALAQTINDAKVAAITRRGGQLRLWGNTSLYPADSQYQFLSVRRTVDTIIDSIDDALLWAVDRPITSNLLSDIEETINNYLRGLLARGAILGGRATIDPDLNSPASLSDGKLYVDFDVEPPAPAQYITFRVQRNIDYYDSLFA